MAVEMLCSHIIMELYPVLLLAQIRLCCTLNHIYIVHMHGLLSFLCDLECHFGAELSFGFNFSFRIKKRC